MELKNKVAVVTGGANGIGRALCRKFAAEGARGVVVADVDADGAGRVAAEIGGLVVPTDVSLESEIFNLVEKASSAFGQIDLFCSNAGIVMDGGAEVSDSNWQRIIGINLMAHIYAARAVVPAMLARGEGYLLQTISAAGLLTSIGSAPYSVTKHGALAFAEWLSITYGDSGIKVSALCPQGVRTNMFPKFLESDGEFLREGALEPEQVADIVVAGLAKEQFLILPHPQVAEYLQRKASDYDRWIRGMRRLRDKVYPRKPGKA
jgi:NAD(P)-dependent dehydrogenase (short-subunit alcohol dehydrogenase family)